MANATNTPAPSTANVLALFRTATPEEIAEGAEWYPKAFDLASGLAVKHGVTVQVAAGVIAALSPLNSWGNNVTLAARFLEAGGLDKGYLFPQLAKARAILAGADILPTLGGLKTQNFYLSILTGGRDGVTIDRHAWSLAVDTRYSEGKIPSLTGKRYAAAVQCYVEAAAILSAELDVALTPAAVQSVTWEVWRRRFWAKGAFDSHAVEV